jgi:hypothetical protein
MTHSHGGILESNVDDPRFAAERDATRSAPAEWTDTNAALSTLTPDEPGADGIYGWFAALVEASVALVGEALGALAQHR